ncbi:MAG TPA: MFS transporter [Pseudonocardiaceae bacterium]
MGQATGTGVQDTAPAERLPREVWVLVWASFVIAIGFGILAPALPTFATSFDVGVTAASVVISVFAFMRLAFAPVSGRLVSLLGERPVYVWGLVIVALSTGACAFAQNYWQLLVFRGLGGIGSTMFTVSAVALLVRLSPPSMRGRSAGLWATSFLLGNIAGPLVGSGLLAFSLRAPFVVYAASLLLAAFVAWIFLRKSTLADPDRDNTNPALTVREAVRHRTYVAALASSFANGWAVFGVRISLIPLFVVEALEREEGLAGISLAVFAAGNAAVLMISGRLADAYGRKPLVLAGLVVSGCGTIWLGYTEGVTTFLLASLVAGIGAGVLGPPHNAAVADVVGANRRGGTVLAAFQMAADVGAILGPILTGLLAESLSYSSAFALTGAMLLLSVPFWLWAPETLPGRTRGADPAVPGPAASVDSVDPTVRAMECGCLDEGPEVPHGRRIAGRPRQPES